MNQLAIWAGMVALFWLFEALVLGRDAASAAGAALVLASGVSLGTWLGARRRRRRNRSG